VALTSSDKKAVTDEVHRLIHIAEQFFNCRFPLPDVSFRRSGKNAGTAFLQQNRVNFNPVLLAENKDAFFAEVIAHEVSHLLTWQKFGKVKPHGNEWQAIMREVFNCEPSTTHNFDLSGLKIRTFPYQCSCQTINLSVRRHNKVLKGMQYRCTRCGEMLTSNIQA